MEMRLERCLRPCESLEGGVGGGRMDFKQLGWKFTFIPECDSVLPEDRTDVNSLKCLNNYS